MKKYFVLLVLLLGNLLSFVNAYDYVKDGFPPLQTVQQNNVNKVKQYNNLSRYEKRLFGKSYDTDDLENRISRLEEKVLGTIFEGDLNKRYQTLRKTIPSYLRNRNRYTDYPIYTESYTNSIPTYTTTTYTPQYYSQPITTSTSGWRGLAGSLGNFIFGTPTGMSPQIYSPFVSDYGPDYQRGMYTNHGWRLNNMHTGSGVGIRMLP